MSGVHAQSPQEVLTRIENSVPSFLRPVLPTLEQFLCKQAALLLQKNVIKYGNREFDLILFELKVACMETVWETEIETGIAEAAAAIPFEIGLPVLLFADLKLCNYIVNQLLLPGPAAAENVACSYLLSVLHAPPPPPGGTPPNTAVCANPNAVQIRDAATSTATTYPAVSLSWGQTE
jgi:hypothetical protein